MHSPPQTATSQMQTHGTWEIKTYESQARVMGGGANLSAVRRMTSPREKTLSPLARRIHSPDISHLTATRSTPAMHPHSPAEPARPKYHVQVSTVPYSPSTPGVHVAPRLSPPSSPFPVSLEGSFQNASQGASTLCAAASGRGSTGTHAWGTPTGTPTRGVPSPRHKFISDKHASHGMHKEPTSSDTASPEIFFCYPVPPARAQRVLDSNGARTFGEFRRSPRSPPRSPDTTSFARSKPRVNTGPSSRRNQNSSTPPRHIMAQTATSPTATYCNAMQHTGVLCNTPPRHVMAQTTASATAFETATTCAFASASKAAVNDAVCTSRNSATVATSSARNTANGRQVTSQLCFNSRTVFSTPNVSKSSPSHGPYLTPPSTVSSARTMPSARSKRQDINRHLDQLGWYWDSEVQANPPRPRTTDALLPPYKMPSRLWQGAYTRKSTQRDSSPSSLRLSRLVQNVKWWHQSLSPDERASALSHRF
mmetsp:Transcript_20898/g.30686  ORF Transcript_20898/g.30686 Transcript_20898/m.30686 type:complete len:480 (-) Transcript_20898:115-1554(-)